MKNNKKRNVVAYVFSGLTIPLGAITLIFLDVAAKLLQSGPAESGSFAESFAGALGAAFAIAFAIIIAIMTGITTFVFGIISIVILATCIKQTAEKRRIANIVVLSIVSLVLLAIIIGMILVMGVFPNMNNNA